MEQKSFIGKFSGFLKIGEEKAEYKGKKLISYYAKPYCTKEEDVPNCIEFKNGNLTISDVTSPDGEEFDCIWEDADIGSVLDKLGKVTDYNIWKFSCSKINYIFIPMACKAIRKSAFVECSSLKEIICYCTEDGYEKEYFYDDWQIGKELQIKVRSVNAKNCEMFGYPDGGSLEDYTDKEYKPDLNETDNTLFYLFPDFNPKKAKSVIIPDGVTVIGRYAFSYCENLKEVKIPDGVTEIGSYAFCGCKNLKEVNIPDGVTRIGDKTFYGCEKLKEIKIPDSVTSIGIDVFFDCINLKDKIPDSVTVIKDSIYEISIKRQRYENNCVVVKTIPTFSGKTFVASGLYYDEKLVKAFLTDNGAFLRGSVSGKTDYLIVSLEHCDESTYEDVLEQAAKGHTVKVIFYEDFIKYVSDGVIEIRRSDFEGCENLIQIPEGVTRIGNFAFEGFKNLKEIKIPDGVTEIGDSAFCDCENLKEIKIPDSVTKIGDGAFCRCENLEEIKIPDSVTEIGAAAFLDCKNLKEVKIPDSVTVIGDRAFFGCKNLKEVKIPDGVTRIESCAFRYCKNLKEVKIPDGVTEIGSSAFSYCEKLKEVKIPDGVTRIGDEAFYGCENLKEVNIPDSLTSIGIDVFSGFIGCINLKNKIPDSVTVIKDSDYEILIKRQIIENNFVVVKTIPTFSGVTFVASGIDDDYKVKVKAFLTDKGAFLRGSVSGKTDYLIVSPEHCGERKYEAVLEQAAKGHTVKIIFYEDFIKYMEKM